MRSESTPAIGATKIGIAVHGSIRRPASQRRVALHGLEELREQEDRAEHPEEHQQRGDVGRREGRGCGRSAAAASARRRAAPRARTAPSSDHAGGRARPTISGLVQPSSLPRTRPQTMPNRPALARASPGRSSESVRAAALRQAQQRQREQDEADRHVQPEDPLPGDALDDGAADERAERDGEAADPAPDAERDAAPRRRDGARTGSSASAAVTIAPPTPCTRAGRDRARSIDGASAASAEPTVKIARPMHEHPAAAEAVAERGAGEQQHREGQRVGVDRPLEPLQATRRGRPWITGSAVVTTRLSSVTMNSATEVTMKVQIGRCSCTHALSSPLPFVT